MSLVYLKTTNIYKTLGLKYLMMLIIILLSVSLTVKSYLLAYV